MVEYNLSVLLLNKNLLQAFEKHFLSNDSVNEVYINPDGEKNFNIGSFYPDVVVDMDNEEVLVYAVETETSLAIGNVLEKWDKYSEAFDEFHIAVPHSHIDTAREMIKAAGIDNGEVKGYEMKGEGVRII